MAESMVGAGKYVGIEASIAAFNAVCVDTAGKLAGSRSAPFDPAEGTLPQLTAFIKDLQAEFGSFERVGIAVPGLINRETGRVEYSAHIPAHSEIDLKGELQAATGMQVCIENDANAAAYGELKCGAGRGSTDLFYTTLGAGVGGAFIFNGEIWRGASGFAGEFGFVSIDAEGLRLEEMASSANIVRRTRNRFHQDSTSSLNKLEEDEITLSSIIAAAQNEDDFARLMLERTGMFVGTAVASVINLLNIEKVVIGGEIMKANEMVLDAVIAKASELSFAPSFERTQIVAGELDKNASAIGVALLTCT
jgi:glucokinase